MRPPTASTTQHCCCCHQPQKHHHKYFWWIKNYFRSILADRLNFFQQHMSETEKLVHQAQGLRLHYIHPNIMAQVKFQINWFIDQMIIHPHYYWVMSGMDITMHWAISLTACCLVRASVLTWIVRSVPVSLQTSELIICNPTLPASTLARAPAAEYHILHFSQARTTPGPGISATNNTAAV